MAWVVKLEEIVNGKVVTRRKIGTVEKPVVINSVDDIGLRIAEGKALLSSIQQTLVESQFDRDGKARATCATCRQRQVLKDYRTRTFDTVYGRVSVRRPRFRCRQCGLSAMALLPRSTSEFDAIRAKLAAYLPYRVVSEVLGELLPVTGGSTHTTIRNRTFFTAERITQAWTASNSKVSPLPATELTLGLDSAFIRSTTPKTARHHMVLVGNIEKGCTRRPFAGIQSDEPQITRILRAHLNHMGYRDDTTLTVLTDGDAGLRGLARTATKTNIVPVLDWFHIAMRIQHMKQAAKGFKTRVRTHVEAKKAIQEELEHLHWRLWHGRTDAVDKSLKRLVGEVRRFRHYIKRNWRMMEGPRTFWAMLHELKRYVKNNDVVITDYHRRQRDGSRVATSLVESAVNSLVNQRMNKRRQMRWTEYGAHQLLQVRTAVVNGEFERLTCPSETSPVSHVDALPMAA